MADIPKPHPVIFFLFNCLGDKSMSRQNKAAKNAVRDKAFSEGRKSGNPGPKQTTPKHGKKNTKWNHPETAKARAAVLGKFHDKQEGKTVLEKINEKKEKVNLNHRSDRQAQTVVEIEQEVEAIKTAEE